MTIIATEWEFLRNPLFHEWPRNMGDIYAGFVATLANEGHTPENGENVLSS